MESNLNQNMNILGCIVGKKIRCLTTADDSHDEKTISDGFPSYHVEPPLDIFTVPEAHPTPNNVIRSDNVLGTQNTDLIEELTMEVLGKKKKNMKIIMMIVMKLPLIVEKDACTLQKWLVRKWPWELHLFIRNRFISN